MKNRGIYVCDPKNPVGKHCRVFQFRDESLPFLGKEAGVEGVREFRSSGVQEFRSSGVRSRQANPECEEEHVVGKRTKLGNTIQGPSGLNNPTRQRLATSRKRTLRSRQRWRHEAYGAGAKAV